VDPVALSKLMEAVARGEVSTSEAFDQVVRLPFSDLGFARVDHHRALRQGVPEVIYGPGKAPEQVLAIATDIVAREQTLLVTRVSEAQASLLTAELTASSYNPRARTVSLQGPFQTRLAGRVVVVTAGTSDLPVAEEAEETLTSCGVDFERVTDVGVSGLHRLLASLDRVATADVVIVVAGMEGALPSVVGGLVACPVIAVPTSVGYGAALHGFTALAAMLTSCASGITVVNIDNGFGAALGAVRILQSKHRGPPA
jgi:NCAIR mutase (PurE)-related protein